ncbi:hypothetical protein Cgig2_016437 [Carnegiea gigantea]|uniref:Uncharacterized protein n=1 Tax=Carnegiea gigantea TaxID=171969 RepID=A0A9Q1QCD5_9CARY|nr:hypothetical protein Cgig2_016437 [Carnegiea gigantea]
MVNRTDRFFFNFLNPATNWLRLFFEDQNFRGFETHSCLLLLLLIRSLLLCCPSWFSVLGARWPAAAAVRQFPSRLLLPWLLTAFLDRLRHLLFGFAYGRPLRPSLPLPLQSVRPHHVHSIPPRKSIHQATLFVEKYHANKELQFLIEDLKAGNLSALQLLEDDGDWDKTQFWAVMKFLQQSARFEEIPEVPIFVLFSFFAFFIDDENSGVSQQIDV